MNAVTQRQLPQQLSAATRAGVAFAAFAMIAAGVVFAGDASEHAVMNAEAAMNPPIRYVVLPSVEVIAKKQAGDIADACPATPMHATAQAQI